MSDTEQETTAEASLGKFILGVLVCAGLGALCIWGGTWYTQHSRSMETYTPTTGMIKKVSVSKRIEVRGVMVSGKDYLVNVDYVYRVADKDFTGSGSIPFKTMAEAETKASTCDVGTGITIYYDPSDPSYSVLDKTVTELDKSFWHPLTIFGFILLAFVPIGIIRRIVLSLQKT